jgi:alpha-beta hydrolase superfamily lysophospholipase
VDESGVLTLDCAGVSSTEEVLFTNVTYTKSRIVFHTESGDVVSYLAAPERPLAAVVYAPGAGERPPGHEERMVRYAAEGFVFHFIDTRGNGGETEGLPFGQQMVTQDYERFEKGMMPQYFMSVCDLTAAQKLLTDRFHVPVYVMGSSNGGRYAAVAAGTNPNFEGYVGISTSDWGLLDSVTGQGLTGDPVRFAASIEPGTSIGRIAPRPVWIFHAEEDPFIPLEAGEELFSRAQEPKTFTVFSGSHGINSDVDERILGEWAQIYAPRG